MLRFDTKDFGEAAPFLRKSDLELLTSRTIAFDGRGSFFKVTFQNTIL